MNQIAFLIVFSLLPYSSFAFIEPFTGGAGIYLVGAALSYWYGGRTLRAVLDLTVCNTGFGYRLYECCGQPWIKPKISDLKNDLRRSVFGQHIAENIVPASLRVSIDEYSPTKPLVLSFHGPPGVGKNYVATFIAKNYFLNGERSKFYHYFNSGKHFPRKDYYRTYQDQLRSWIVGNVTECPYSMFVFDEIDKMPVKILDGIKTFLDHHNVLDGVDYRRTIFIFISNIGESIITKRYLELWQNEGKTREQMTINDFDKVLNKGAFNEPGGLQMSDIIDHNLIDFYVPFLPLEKKHVISCIEASMNKLKYRDNENEVKEEVMKTVSFVPEPEALFAFAGCRRVDQQVRTLVFRYMFGSHFNEDSLNPRNW